METMERDPKYIADTLRSLRKMYGLTQENLAGAATLSTRTIEKAESGRHSPDEQTLRSIARALDLDVTIFEKPTPEQKAETERHQKERSMLAAFGDVMSSSCPLDPEHPWDLDAEGFGKPEPDRLHFVTEDGRVYSLNRKEAEAAFEAYQAGDDTAVRSLLQVPVANAR